MRFIMEDNNTAAVAVAAKLAEHLTGDTRVIWLVCGGSNIATEVIIMNQLRESSGGHLGNLLVLPMDERYGAPGHADSNYRQLQDAGFEPGSAMWIDVLARDLPLAETVERYGELVARSFAAADYILGVFGLGSDGHTAGVLPKTPAVYETVTSVVSYDSPPYTRLTLTPHELVRANTAFVLAYGDSKKTPLERLQRNSEDLEALPSKLLYGIPEKYVYNDQIESEA